MDKKSTIGLILMGIILAVWVFMSGPSKEEKLKKQAYQDSLVNAEKKKKEELLVKQIQKPKVKTPDTITVKNIVTENDSVKQVRKKNSWADFLPASEGKEETLTIENEKIKAFISTKSGRITNVILKEFKKADKKTPLELFEKQTSNQEIIFNCYENSKSISLDSMYFIADKKQVIVSGEQTSSLKLKLPTSKPGSYIEYVYTLKGNDYLVDHKMNFVKMDSIISPNSIVIMNMAMLYPTQEKHIEKERQISSVYFCEDDGDIDNLSLTKDDSTTKTESELKWVAFKQQFFTAAIINQGKFATGTNMKIKPFGQNENFITNLDINYVKGASANLYLADPLAKGSFNLKYYFGPNDYLTMKKYDMDLEDIIPMGWTVFSYINKWLVVPVFYLFRNTDFNYGWVILILTFVIKGLLLPIGYMTFKSSAKMKVLKPETDKINEKFGADGDPMKKQQETMALYNRAGVSPFSGCLPLVFQMFVLIALFNYFPAAFELRQKTFLWADDLSTYDSIFDFGFNIPLYGGHVSLFALLMFASTLGFTFYQQKMFPNQQTNMPGMKFMMYAMPFLFLGFMNSYSAGLSWYYFVANIINILQNILLKFFIKDEALRAEVDKNLKNPNKKKKGFAARLEEMAKQRQQLSNRK
jgi:YidC/Oxa1 family membrane protein insertase